MRIMNIDPLGLLSYMETQSEIVKRTSLDPCSLGAVPLWNSRQISELRAVSVGGQVRQGGAVGVLERGAEVSVWGQGRPLRHGRFDE